MEAERDALLKAIADAPGDELPKQVYRDWLTDHGEPLTEPYRPSNGTEGMIFDEEWCCRCTKYRMGACGIIGRAMLYEIDDPKYPKQWVEDVVTGRPTCTAFVDEATYVRPSRARKPARGQLSLL